MFRKTYNHLHSSKPNLKDLNILQLVYRQAHQDSTLNVPMTLVSHPPQKFDFPSS